MMDHLAPADFGAAMHARAGAATARAEAAAAAAAAAEVGGALESSGGVFGQPGLAGARQRVSYQHVMDWAPEQTCSDAGADSLSDLGIRFPVKWGA